MLSLKKWLVVLATIGLVLSMVCSYIANYQFRRTMAGLSSATSVVLKARTYIDHRVAYIHIEVTEKEQLLALSKLLSTESPSIAHGETAMRRMGGVCACSESVRLTVNREGHSESFYFHGHGVIARYHTVLRGANLTASPILNWCRSTGIPFTRDE